MEGGRKKERYEQEFEKDWKPDYPEFAVNQERRVIEEEDNILKGEEIEDDGERDFDDEDKDELLMDELSGQ